MGLLPGSETPVFTLDGIRKFHSWTHSSLTMLLDHLSTIPASDYTSELSGFGRPTVQQQVIHIFNCEGFWIHVLQGLPYQGRTPGDCTDIIQARLLQQEVRQHTLTYLSGISDQQLNSDTELRFADADVDVRTPALVLHHVLSHAFHHKGQIVAMCRLLGHPAPDTDLNQFV
jgi:uncharacterized damage-inducible protein DinB